MFLTRLPTDCCPLAGELARPDGDHRQNARLSDNLFPSPPSFRPSSSNTSHLTWSWSQVRLPPSFPSHIRPLVAEAKQISDKPISHLSTGQGLDELPSMQKAAKGRPVHESRSATCRASSRALPWEVKCNAATKVFPRRVLSSEHGGVVLKIGKEVVSGAGIP